jgi:hypothetical protein
MLMTYIPPGFDPRDSTRVIRPACCGKLLGISMIVSQFKDLLRTPSHEPATYSATGPRKNPESSGGV